MTVYSLKRDAISLAGSCQFDLDLANVPNAAQVERLFHDIVWPGYRVSSFLWLRQIPLPVC